MADRYTLTQSAVADAGGVCQIIFDTPPPNLVLIGSVVVINAPPASYWTVLAGGQLWGSALGATPVIVQAIQGEKIAVVATGLSVGAEYAAVFSGTVYDRTVEPVPWASPMPLPKATAGAALSFVPGAPGTGGVNPPNPPPGPGPGGIIIATAATVSVTAAGVNVMAGIAAPFGSWLSFTLSNPENGPSLWVQYGVNGLTGDGIEMPSPSFLYEDTWRGSVFAASTGAAVNLGLQVLHT